MKKKPINKDLRKYAQKVVLYLMRCWEMWHEIATSNTMLAKNDTKSFEKYRIDCWACEFYHNCSKCIMIELWPDKCIWTDSPYDKWEFSSTLKSSKKYAKVIADFAVKKAQRIVMRHGLGISYTMVDGLVINILGINENE